MTKILITGASGFIGTALVRYLAEKGDFRQIIAVLHHQILTLPIGVDFIQVPDLSGGTNWRTALSEVEIVVHAAARTDKMQETSSDSLVEFRQVNVQGTLNLGRQAVDAGVKRFVFVSSVKVNGESTPFGRPFTADDPPSPVDPYGISKYEAENALLQLMAETGMEVVIIRPPLVYGPGVKANFLKLLQLTQKRFPVPLGSVHNSRSMVYIGNFVSAIMLCIVHPKAAGEIFLVNDGEDVSIAELIRKLASAMGYRALLLPIPPTLLKAIFSLAGKRAEIERLTGSLCVDPSKLREVLDWHPPYTLDQGIKETADWYLTRG